MLSGECRRRFRGILKVFHGVSEVSEGFTGAPRGIGWLHRLSDVLQ